MNVDTTVALVTLADAREYLKLGADTTQDSILGWFINAASRFANRYTGRHLLEKVHTEHYDGDATNELILKNFPVSEITSLNQDPERVFGATTAINVSADVLADKTSGVLRLWNNETRFTRGSGNVKIVYKAGYLLADVPTEVKLAVLEIIALNYKRYQEGKFHVKSETVGQMNTAFSDDDIPKSARTVLDMYRAHGVSGYAF